VKGGYPLHSDHVRDIDRDARCSTDEQDLTAQRDRLRELGVSEKRIYLDRGLTGNPGLIRP
jgi:DNA invertase Pin-like site-specific DNA recombinase